MSIKELREKSGMSQSQFAKYFGIPVRTIQCWEIGQRKPPDYVTNLLEEVLEKKLSMQAFANMDRFASDEECEKILLTRIDTIYNEQGQAGLAKLLDRFIFFTGIEDALKIVEDYIDESGID